MNASFPLWVGWTTDATKRRLEERLEALGASTTAMDCILSRPETYSTKLHASAEPLDGSPRRALCGVAIPPNDGMTSDPVAWWNERDGVPKCRRCVALEVSR